MTHVAGVAPAPDDHSAVIDPVELRLDRLRIRMIEKGIDAIVENIGAGSGESRIGIIHPHKHAGSIDTEGAHANCIRAWRGNDSDSTVPGSDEGSVPGKGRVPIIPHDP